MRALSAETLETLSGVAALLRTASRNAKKKEINAKLCVPVMADMTRKC